MPRQRSGQIAGNHPLEETPGHPTGINGLWNTELTERSDTFNERNFDPANFREVKFGLCG
jgi:hypothetical protein